MYSRLEGRHWRGQINMTRMPFHMANHTITVRNGGVRLYVCHVLGLVQKQLRSVIKKSEHYSIQGVLVVQDKGREVAADKKNVKTSR